MTSSKTMWWPMKPPGADGKKVAPEPTLPPPSPVVMEIEETEEAKRRVRGRKRGRPSTILAGRLTSEHGKVLLGE